MAMKETPVRMSARPVLPFAMEVLYQARTVRSLASLVRSLARGVLPADGGKARVDVLSCARSYG